MSLVQWMVELLLAFTGTQVTQEEGLAHKQHIKSTANLKPDYESLVSELASFTKHLTK